MTNQELVAKINQFRALAKSLLESVEIRRKRAEDIQTESIKACSLERAETMEWVAKEIETILQS